MATSILSLLETAENPAKRVCMTFKQTERLHDTLADWQHENEGNSALWNRIDRAQRALFMHADNVAGIMPRLCGVPEGYF